MKVFFAKKIIIACLCMALAALTAGCGASAVTFAYFGDAQADPQTGDYSLLKTLASGARGSAEFFVFGGDMVNDEDDAGEWASFMSAVGGAKIFTASGNHTKGEGYLGRFSLPQNGPEGYEGLFYSFERGFAHITVMDSNLMGSADAQTVRAISAWLRGDLAGARAPQRIVVLHHPMFPLSAAPKDEARAENMRKNYLPIMQEGEVRLILCGHQHMYARSLSQPVQIMGNASPKSYEPSAEPAAYFAEPVYTLVCAQSDAIYISTHDAQGNIVDEAKI